MPYHLAEFPDTAPARWKCGGASCGRGPPGERIAIAFAMTDFVPRLSESGVRARHPGASEREVFLRSVALRLPKDLMIRAYGWHPDMGIPVE